PPLHLFLSAAHRRCARLCPSGWGRVTRPRVRLSRARPYAGGAVPDPSGTAPLRRSAAQAEALDQRPVALDVGLLEVAQQALALADEQQQTTTGVVVVLVLARVLGELLDAVRQQRDLHLGR